MRVTLLQPRGGLTSQTVANALSVVGTKVTPDMIDVLEWTTLELALAYDWAMRVHLRASDNPSVRVRPKPSFVREVQL